MAPQVKNAGVMTILLALFTTMIIGVVSWIGINASHVPELEQELKYEVAQLNANIERLTKTAEETNAALTAYTKFHAANLTRITEALIDHKYRIIAMEHDCKAMHIDVKDCAKYRKVDK